MTTELKTGLKKRYRKQNIELAIHCFAAEIEAHTRNERLINYKDAQDNGMPVFISQVGKQDMWVMAWDGSPNFMHLITLEADGRLHSYDYLDRMSSVENSNQRFCPDDAKVKLTDKNYLCRLINNNPELGLHRVSLNDIAVIDHFMSGTPGYVGAVGAVVDPENPLMFSVITVFKNQFIFDLPDSEPATEYLSDVRIY